MSDSDKFLEKFRADVAIARTDVLDGSLERLKVYYDVIDETIIDLTIRKDHVGMQVQIMQEELEQR